MKEDHRSYRRNFCSCEKKAWKKLGLYGIRTLTSAIPVQRSTNWANKPAGCKSLNWFVINPWKDDDEVTNIWKSYMRNCGVKNYMKEDHRSYRSSFISFRLILLEIILTHTSASMNHPPPPPPPHTQTHTHTHLVVERCFGPFLCEFNKFLSGIN